MMNAKNKFLILVVLVFTIQTIHAQTKDSNSLNCSTWDCLEKNKNQIGFISGVFQKYTPNTAGKGANHMYWDWEIMLSDSLSVPLNSTLQEINYKAFEGKKVLVKGNIFYGIIIGTSGGQNATGFRIDPFVIEEIKE